MSLNKQDTNINTIGGRFAPNVSYGTTIRQPAPVAADFPKVQPTNFNIDLSGLMRAASQKDAQDAQAMYDKGLGDYAMSVEEIVEGQRQQVYDATTAERMIRTLTSDYLQKGYASKDLAATRNAHDGGILANEESRQKLIMEHEQNRQLKRIDDIRKDNPGMQHLSDAAVERKLAYIDGLYDTVNNINSSLRTLDSRSQEYGQMLQERNYVYQQFTEANLYTNLNNMMQDALMSGKKISAEDVTNMKRIFINDAMSKGMTASEAVFNWEQAYNRTDLATLYNETNKDLTDNTEFMKKVVGFVDQNVQMGLRSTYEGMAVMNMPSEIRANLAQYSRGFYDSFVDQVFKKNYTKDKDGRMMLESVNILGKNIPADYKDNLKFSHAILNSNLSDISYPPRLNANQIAYVSGLDANGVVSDGNSSDTDLNNAITNANNFLRTYETPAVQNWLQKAKASGDPRAAAAVDEAEFNIQVLRGKKAGSELSLSYTDSKRTLNSIMNSLQAGRLRIDPNTGYFVMLEDTKGFLQSAGDLFASEGTRQSLNKLNSFLDSYTPVERQIAARVMTSDQVPMLRSGEAVWDTSKQSLYEKGIDAASTIATDSLQFGENLQRNDADILEQAANRLEEQTNNLSPAAKKEYAEGNKKAIEEARKKAKELRGQATIKSTTPLANASMMSEDGYLPAADTPVIDMYDPDKEIVIPNKEDVNIPTLPGAIAMRQAELEYLEKVKKSMDNYPEEYDDKIYQQITTRIAQIEKVLEKYNR